MGDTALHLAAQKGNLEIATVLLNAGALAAAVNNEELTPAQVASKFKQKKVTSFSNKSFRKQGRTLGAL